VHDALFVFARDFQRPFISADRYQHGIVYLGQLVDGDVFTDITPVLISTPTLSILAKSFLI